MVARTLVIGVVFGVVSIVPAAGGAPIMSEDFESYALFSDPAGPEITMFAPAYAYVADSYIGQTSQCLVIDPPKSTLSGAMYDVPDTSTGRVTFEVDVSFSGLIGGHFLQTVASNGVSWVRLYMIDDGNLYAASASPGAHFMGSYGVDEVFRLRVVQDLDAMLYWVSIDDELDGFADETPLGPLEPFNDPSGLPNVGAVSLMMDISPNSAAREASVAYDNFAMWIPAPGAGMVFVMALGAGVMRRRR